MAVRYSVDKIPSFSNEGDMAVYQCDLTYEQYEEHLESDKTISLKYVTNLEYKYKEKLGDIFLSCLCPTIILFLHDKTTVVCSSDNPNLNGLMH